ncbi:protein hinderin [Lingula anatina]|uniref:Protein hinderin n=1 Tax=Lingula anatina TaxID=7574 RepID=A0A1S3JFB9_LINAN|nr:protein hinderin [Lingula anatina]|eukprot:XP_013409110.1 protein hinderin [Lingula anatina]
MAEYGRGRAMEIFWTKFDSDIEETGEAVVDVPGVKNMGNLRPQRKITGQRTREVRPQVPKGPPVVEELANSSADRKTKSDRDRESKSREEKENVWQKRPKHARSASLKDLRPEDKKRVANLIKELAKVGEEKDSAQQQLQGERDRYQKQMAELERQKQQIIREREELQKQFLDTQALLLKYQKQVMDQQKQLDDSLTQMLTPPKTAKEPVPERDEFHGFDPPPVQRRVDMATTRLTMGPVSTPGRGTHEVIDVQRYTPTHRQHSNYQMPSYTGRLQQVQAAETHPYTHFIDQQIAQERQFSQEDKPNVSVSQPQDMNFGSRPPADVGGVGGRLHPGYQYDWKASTGYDYNRHGLDSDSEYIPENRNVRGGNGPLQAPIMSSTQRSDGFQQSQKSRTAAGEFEPLVPGSSSTSHVSSGSMYGNDAPGAHLSAMLDHSGQLTRPPRVTFAANQMSQIGPIRHTFPATAVDNDQINDQSSVAAGYQGFKDPEKPSNSPISTNFHDHLNEQGFIRYYKGLTPEQRKRELLAQKANLIQEQNRLRQILAEQEGQLKQKQQQLHNRQLEQRQRLMHFEKTGQFPQPLSNLEGKAPIGAGQYKAQSPVSDQMEGDISDTDKNLEFLENHGVDTSPLRSSRARSRLEDRFQEGGSNLTSVATSPISPERAAGNATSPQRSSFMKVMSPAQRSVVKTYKQGNLPLHLNRQKTSPMKRTAETSPVSSKAMSVVDIVESIENGDSPRPLGNRIVEFEDDVQAAEEEESRVLEEVFFMR